MDWSNVSSEELIVALKEVDWNQKPRPLSEMFQKFSLPNTRSKWSSRLKCNLYYYRTNYFIFSVTCFIVSFFRNPLAFISVAVIVFTTLLWNDSFAHSVSERLVRLARKLHPPLAAQMRNPGNPTPPGRPGMRRKTVYICGQDRRLIVTLLYGSSGLTLWATSALYTIGMTLGAALGGIGAHASFRQPNLKAKLSSYHEEFRAVWRGYNGA